MLSFGFSDNPPTEIHIHDTSNWRCNATSAKCQHGVAKNTYRIQTMPKYKALCQDLKGTTSERRSGVTILGPSRVLRKLFAPAGAIQRSQATCLLPTPVFNVFVNVLYGPGKADQGWRTKFGKARKFQQN